MARRERQIIALGGGGLRRVAYVYVIALVFGQYDPGHHGNAGGVQLLHHLGAFGTQVFKGQSNARVEVFQI